MTIRGRIPKSYRSATLALGSLCVAIIATVVIAGVSAAAPHELGGTPVLSPAARGAFSVFDQPGSSGALEGVTALARLETVDPASVHVAQDTAMAQVLVAGGEDAVCLVGRIPQVAETYSCAPVASASDAATPLIQAGSAGGSEGKLLVTALFPDGITSASITSADGRVTPVSVVNNTIEAIASPADTVRWTSASGGSFSSPVPH